MTVPEWEIAYILPNLQLQSEADAFPYGAWPNGIDLESETLALVPRGDMRVQNAANASPQARRLIDGPTRPTGRSGFPRRPTPLPRGHARRSPGSLWPVGNARLR